MCQDRRPLDLSILLLPDFEQPLPDHQELQGDLEEGEEGRDRGSIDDDRDTGKELVEIEGAEILLGEFSVDINKSEIREASDQVIHSDDPLHLSNKVVDKNLDEVDVNEKTKQEIISCYKAEVA